MNKTESLNNKILGLLKSKPYSLELIEEIESEIKTFDNFKKPKILDLINLNLDNGHIKSLNSILGILYSTYDFEGEIEQKISSELIKVLNVLTETHYGLDKANVEFSYYLIFDIYFHNPGLIEGLGAEQTNDLIKEIADISNIKYPAEKSKSSDLIMALQKIIDVTSYFGKEVAELILKSYFLTHFDEFIKGCAEDQLKLN